MTDLGGKWVQNILSLSTIFFQAYIPSETSTPTPGIHTYLSDIYQCQLEVLENKSDQMGLEHVPIIETIAMARG